MNQIVRGGDDASNPTGGGHHKDAAKLCENTVPTVT
jgi:hypothetical protein